MREVKNCPDVIGQKPTSVVVSYPLGTFVIEVDENDPILVDSEQDDPNQLARALLKMQSAFGYRTQAQMLDEYFDGDLHAMVNAATHGGTR